MKTCNLHSGCILNYEDNLSQCPFCELMVNTTEMDKNDNVLLHYKTQIIKQQERHYKVREELIKDFNVVIEELKDKLLEEKSKCASCKYKHSEPKEKEEGYEEKEYPDMATTYKKFNQYRGY